MHHMSEDERMNNDMIPVGTTVHINPEDIKWEWNGGDLISRRDIKDHIGELLLVYSGEELANAILNAIDNALTVPNEYMRGYEAAEREYKRPQGKWIVKSNGTTNYYACNKCENAGDIQDKFCRECGADMRKGGADNG